MIIISWDVGVIHLAYCILKYDFDVANKKVNIEILDWDEINLIGEDRIKIECCGKMKAKKGETPKTCGKNATYYLNITPIPSKDKPVDEPVEKTIEETNDALDEDSSKEKVSAIKMYDFCKTHLPQHNEYWSQTNTQMLFREIKPGHECEYLKKDGDNCGKKCKHVFKHNDVKKYLCTTHYKSELNKKIKEFSPQLIKNLIVKKYPTSKLQFNLIKKLDELAEHFAKLKIEEVVIENQPSQKNPKMKSIANTLFDYFMIRGYVDKIHEMDIQMVRFMCPSNKLKVNNDNTIEVFKANKDSTKKYKLTKALGIQYTKQLISHDSEQLDYLNLYAKKDDICDAYLQGRYYLEFIRNKGDSVPEKKPRASAGSKTSKKPTISKKITKTSAKKKTDDKKKTKKTTKAKNNKKTISIEELDDDDISEKKSTSIKKHRSSKKSSKVITL